MISMPPESRQGAPWAGGVLSSSDCRFPQSRVLLHQVGDIQDYVDGIFCPRTCPGLSAGTSEPCDVATISHSSHPNPMLMQVWAFLRPSTQPPTYPSPQICKGASEDERLQWHLPEGAAFSWLPNPERSLEGKGSPIQHLALAQHHVPTLYRACLPHILLLLLTSGPDSGL